MFASTITAVLLLALKPMLMMMMMMIAAMLLLLLHTYPLFLCDVEHFLLQLVSVARRCFAFATIRIVHEYEHFTKVNLNAFHGYFIIVIIINFCW